MSLNIKVIFLLSVLYLAGCTPPMERFANACSQYGYKPGSVAYANCMQKLDQQNREYWIRLGNKIATCPHGAFGCGL